MSISLELSTEMLDLVSTKHLQMLGETIVANIQNTVAEGIRHEYQLADLQSQMIDLESINRVLMYIGSETVELSLPDTDDYRGFDAD